MENNKGLNFLLRTLSYILVAALASAVTILLCLKPDSKLDRLQAIIEEKFIGEVDSAAIGDAAANAMVSALGDRWSYYIPAKEYAAYSEQKKNIYVGIGVTIAVREDGQGFDILQVEPGGGAHDAGVLPGDILYTVEGQSAAELGTSGCSELIRGDEGTFVKVTVLREEEELEFSLERKTIHMAVAQWEMLDGKIGYVKIRNFNSDCAEQTIAAVEELVEQGATGLVFDVRNNPGGYKTELVDLLNYLLPEGPLFRSVSYTGEETVDSSDENCVELPMAVLINGNSYSAAEFFAAALEEYDWAIVAGEPTTGKGYFQNTYMLPDGSAVGLSVGKYTTPKGVSLAETGGLVPQVLTEVDDQTEALIYAERITPAEDEQLQAAIAALEIEN